MKINVRKTLQNTVTVPDEFPFYVEELTSSDEMPLVLQMKNTPIVKWTMNFLISYQEKSMMMESTSD